MADLDIELVRERFLSDELSTGHVREQIETSWRRSKALEVASTHVAVPFIGEPDLDSLLVAAANPVIENLVATLSDEPISVILTSDDGVVLSRSAQRTDLRHRLDDVQLAPGFSYSEEFVGTNGIGTALATRRSTLVVGPEHYSAALTGLACAGVPIIHPISGVMLGALDMTGRSAIGGQLMLSLAEATVKEIEALIVQHSGEGHVAAFNAYLAERRRNPSAMFIVLGEDMTLMNEKLRRTLGSADVAALIEYAIDGAHAGLRSAVQTLPSGRTVRLTRVEDAGATLALFVVRLADEDTRSGSVRRGLSAALPGLVGWSVPWRILCDELRHALSSSIWVAVDGEAGTGRCAALRAAAETHRPGFVRVFDAAELVVGSDQMRVLEDELADDGFSVIIRNIDRSPAESIDSISALLTMNADRGWVGATMTSSDDSGAVFDNLIVPHFARTVMVPALRHRISDLQVLVPQLLRELTSGGDLAVTPAAMRMLSAYEWPGNVAQLRKVLRDVVRQQRAGTLDVDALPPEVWSHGRSALSPIERMERDAIVEALRAHEFDKERAAAALGISRATIYRRIKQFGISN
ncbi:sigma-54-dependent Fis family transcriptional regulator [Gordonia hydrophobica]|uniref:Helix-turn-helix domain-containing protein n=1 Tax=Gordonia hydrophobica TaxID=40516 RepID=A0ABZ2TXC9_9ACTN|nr:helix-turn-helix domain-containing protein [Gordonia hydrophobica]MBM7366279.1 transcriptional regulator of acetoin/glycerol metabolism [Gordonia hydrophobica]